MPNWLDSISSWFGPPAKPQPPPYQSGGLFQTRVTRTPGTVTPLPGYEAGTYDPRTNPIAAIDARTDLTPQEKARLKQSWLPLGTGFINADPAFAQDPNTLRHEQMHALYERANLAQHAQELADIVDPGIKRSLQESPVYQQEIREMGAPRVLSDEGIATDITSPGGMAQDLQDKVREYLRTNVQQKQFQQLTGSPGQLQK